MLLRVTAYDMLAGGVQCEGSWRQELKYLDSHPQILRKIFRRYIQSKISHNDSITPNPYAIG